MMPILHLSSRPCGQPRATQGWLRPSTKVALTRLYAAGCKYRDTHFTLRCSRVGTVLNRRVSAVLDPRRVSNHCQKALEGVAPDVRALLETAYINSLASSPALRPFLRGHR